MTTKNLIVWVACVVIVSCQSGEQDDVYAEYILDWQKERVQNLTAPDGWTALAGLFWLGEGRNGIGSQSDQKIRFPQEMPEQIGAINYINDTAIFTPNPNIQLTMNGQSIHESMIVWPIDSFQQFAWKTFQWFLIKRGDKLGIRLRNTAHPNRNKLTEIPCYPVDKAWLVEATVSFEDTSRSINIQNIIGLNSATKIAATINFSIGTESFKLFAIPGGPDSYFLIFSDETTGAETYGGGRYLYPPKEDSEGKTILDFNKAYNPPCVFTPYATCPLPPEENHVPIAITAGEQYIDFIH